MRSWLGSLAIFFVACGTSPATITPIEAPIAPIAPIAPTSAPPSSPSPSPIAKRSLACDARLPPPIEVPDHPPYPAPPVAGVMTEQAAQAKRLYDGERWVEASRALTRVMNGESGDDEGNKQLASYHLAICFFRTDSYAEAAKIFAHIATNPGHLKFNEAVLWLVKLVDHEPALVHAMRLYEKEQIARFDNPVQRETFWKASFLAGRERFERGDHEGALRFFTAVGPESASYADANDCITRARAR